MRKKKQKLKSWLSDNTKTPPKRSITHLLWTDLERSAGVKFNLSYNVIMLYDFRSSIKLSNVGGTCNCAGAIVFYQVPQYGLFYSPDYEHQVNWQAFHFLHRRLLT